MECPPWGFFKGILTRIYASFGEKFERLDCQAQPGIEPGTFHVPILNTEPLCHREEWVNWESKQGISTLYT